MRLILALAIVPSLATEAGSGDICPLCPVCNLSMPVAPPPASPPASPECATSIGSLCGEDAQLVLAVALGLPVFIVILLLYLLLWRWFRPKYSLNVERGGEDWRGPAAMTGCWEWIPLVLRISDDDYQHAAGLDALTLLLAHRVMIKALASSFAVGVLLMGLYIMAAFVYDGELNYSSGWGKTVLSNVVWGTDLWEAWVANIFAALGIWACSLFVLHFLRAGWRDVVGRRQAALAALDASGEGGVEHRSVLVLNPAVEGKGKEKQSLTREYLLEVWGELYPGAVLDVQMMRDTGALPKLLGKRAKLVRKLEHLATVIEEKGEEHKVRQVPKVCKKLPAGECRDKASQELQALDQQILHEHAAFSALPEGLNYFVLFKTFRACNMAKAVPNHGVRGLHTILAAPRPSDVNFASLEPDVVNKVAGKRVVASLLYYAMLAFYLVPIVLLSLLLNAENLAFLDPLMDALGPAAKAAFLALLPQLATIIFMALLPTLCMFFSGLMSFPSLSTTSVDAFDRLMKFYFIWFFLGVTLGTTILELVNKASEIADDPMGVLEDTGTALAAAAVYFCTFIALQLLNALPMKELTLVSPIAKEVVFKKLGLQRPDEIQPTPFKYHEVWTKFMFCATIGFCYVVIAPLTTLFSLSYLCLSYILYARNLLFAYTHAYESNGTFYITFSYWTFTVLFVSQLVVLAVLLVNTSPTAVVVVPLLVLTYFAKVHMHTKFIPAMSTLSLLTSMNADARAGLTDALRFAAPLDEISAALMEHTAAAPASDDNSAALMEHKAAAADAQHAQAAPDAAEAGAEGGATASPGGEAEGGMDDKLRELFKAYAQAEFELPDDLKAAAAELPAGPHVVSRV